MAIQDRLTALAVEFRFHLAAAAVVAAAFFSLLSVGPSFATVVSFFGPLLISTGFVLAAVAVLLRISPPPGDSSGDTTGEELIDYVAGRPDDAPHVAADGSDRGGGEGEGEGEVEHHKSQ
ncbi:uncharacterized protein [Typha angustifolia]|uniref:uncharacterized protein n=1 Tax=Typha angustifolia TaxID=59011 RepID=UPI003C2B7D7A